MPVPEHIDLVNLIVAGAGGFVLNMMNLWEDSKKPKPERVQKDLLYCVFFCLLANCRCWFSLDIYSRWLFT